VNANTIDHIEDVVMIMKGVNVKYTNAVVMLIITVTHIDMDVIVMKNMIKNHVYVENYRLYVNYKYVG